MPTKYIVHCTVHSSKRKVKFDWQKFFIYTIYQEVLIAGEVIAKYFKVVQTYVISKVGSWKENKVAGFVVFSQ